MPYVSSNQTSESKKSNFALGKYAEGPCAVAKFHQVSSQGFCGSAVQSPCQACDLPDISRLAYHKLQVSTRQEFHES